MRQVGLGGVVKLADYGALGRVAAEARAAGEAEACAYAAPEVLRQVI